MKIYAIPGEIHLEKIIAGLENNPKGWYIGFLRWKDDTRQGLDLTKTASLTLIKEAISSLEGHLFLCEDQDLIFVVKETPTKYLEQAIQLIGSGLANETAYNHSLYDPRVNFETIQKLIDKKVSTYKERLLNETGQKKEDSTSSILPFDPSLVKSITERRLKAKPTVLVIEDDAFSRKLVHNTLHKIYNVVAAENGAQGINSYVINAPDIVFLDINLPDQTGLQVIDKLKEYDPDAFIVMLSGNAYKENIETALKKGAKGFVGKPFNMEQILKYIETSPHIKKKNEKA